MQNIKTIDDLLSIIVKTYQRPRHLDRLIRSIKKYYPSIPVLVADDSPTPNIRNDVQYYILPPESGLSKGRNYLLRKVQTKYFLLLDDDHIIVPATNLKKMVEILEDNPPLDIVAGDYIFQGIKRQRYHGMYRKKFNFIFHYLYRSKGKLNGYSLYDVVQNFFVGRTDRVKEILWDENIQFAREHEDFFLRAKGRLKITYLSEFHVDHFSYKKFHMGLRGMKYIKIFNKKWKIIDRIYIPKNQPISSARELSLIIKYFVRKSLIKLGARIWLGMLRTTIGFINYLVKNKQFVIILSTERAGSTLLTHLLGQANDVSRISESNLFVLGKTNRFLRYYKALKLSKKRIIVLNFLAPLMSADFYPDIIRLNRNIKAIFLFRTPSAIVNSIQRLEKIDLDQPLRTKKELFKYWLSINKSILSELRRVKMDYYTLSYEELCNHPEEITRQIFKFISSEKKTGVSAYFESVYSEWMWEKGSSSEKLKSIKVQKSNDKYQTEYLDNKECGSFYTRLKRIECKQKIFGIGLSRTGTHSLTRALSFLGFKAVHWKYTKNTIRYSGNYPRIVYNLFDRYSAFTDIPIARVYKDLDDYFPKSKFILTVRDPDEWAVKVKRHIRGVERNGWNLIEQKLIEDLYGKKHQDVEKLKKMYLKHEKDVLSHFKHRPQDLLVLNIFSGDGWNKLCDFLNVPRSENPFPHVR